MTKYKIPNKNSKRAIRKIAKNTIPLELMKCDSKKPLIHATYSKNGIGHTLMFYDKLPSQSEHRG